MKKILLPLLITIGITFSTTAIAAEKTVTIDWTMADTTNIQGYKMYYSTNSDMSNKQFVCETSDATTTSLTCPNVSIVTYPVYFIIAATTSTEELESSVKSFTQNISSVQNFTITEGH